MGEIGKITDHKPVIFADRKQILTYAQRLIYDLLVKKADEGKPVTREDINFIFAIYESDSEKGVQFVWIRVWYKGRIERRKFSIESASNDSYITNRSMPWFKHNLASCIIKGKLIALPIITE